MSQVKFHWDITLSHFLLKKKKRYGQEYVKYIGRKPRYNALGKKYSWLTSWEECF